MEIQSFSVEVIEKSKFQLSWITMFKVQAIQVAIAQDSEFLTNCYNFLLPESAPGCILDVGTGSWFIRVGAWVGDEKYGHVKWSGILGPYSCASTKISTPKTSNYTIKKTQQIESGVRLYTLNPDPNWMYVEISNDLKFSASNTRCRYLSDWGKGYIDVEGLHEKEVYTLRYVPFSNYPTNKMVELPQGKTIQNIKPLSPQRFADHITTGAQAQRKSDLRILQEARDNPNLRFLSGGDYARHLAMQNSK